MIDDILLVTSVLGNLTVPDNSSVGPTMPPQLPVNSTADLGTEIPKKHLSNGNKQLCNGQQQNVLDSLMDGYDRTALPFNQTVQVGVELTIQDVNSISENDASIIIDLWYSQIWNDKRLVYKHLNKTCRDYLSFDSLVFAQLWTPAVCIANSKQVDVHTSPLQNTLLLLFENGTVWLNNRLQVRAPCRINLRNFPLDVQSCEIVLESYPYSNEEVEVDWLPESQFYFKRLWGYYILQAYIPTYVSVCMSWVPFYFDSRALAARTTFVVSSLMTLSFQYASVSRNLPRVSYIKALDLFMFASVAMIFLSVIEQAIVGFLVKREENKKWLARKLRERITPLMQGKSGRVDPRFYNPRNDMSMSRMMSDSDLELNPKQMLQLSRSLTQETTLEPLAPLARTDSFEDLQPVEEEESVMMENEVSNDTPATTSNAAEPESSQATQNGSILKNSFLLMPQFRLKNNKRKCVRDFFRPQRQSRKMSLALMRDALSNRVGIRSVFLSTRSQMEHWSVIDSWCAALFPIIFLIFNVVYWWRVWSIYSSTMLDIVESDE